MHLRGGTGPQPLGSPWAWDGGSSRGSLPWQLPLLTSCLQQLLSLISSPQSHYDHHGNQAVFVPTGWKNLTQDCRGGGASATRSWLRTCQILSEGHYLPRPHSYPLQKEAKGQLAVWGPAPSPARLIHLCKAAVHFPSSPTSSAWLCWVRMEAGPGTRASSRRTHPAGLTPPCRSVFRVSSCKIGTGSSDVSLEAETGGGPLRAVSAPSWGGRGASGPL